MSLVLVLALAAQATATSPAPAAAAKKPVPMSIAVEADARGGAAAKAWADELRRAVEARKDEFRAPRPGEKPEAVVRMESVAPGPEGTNVANGTLVVGGRSNAFSLKYPGPSAAQAESLARNLRAFADQMKAAPPAAPARK